MWKKNWKSQGLFFFVYISIYRKDLWYICNICLKFIYYTVLLTKINARPPRTRRIVMQDTRSGESNWSRIHRRRIIIRWHWFRVWHGAKMRSSTDSFVPRVHARVFFVYARIPRACHASRAARHRIASR